MQALLRRYEADFLAKEGGDEASAAAPPLPMPAVWNGGLGGGWRRHRLHTPYFSNGTPVAGGWPQKN